MGNNSRFADMSETAIRNRVTSIYYLVIAIAISSAYIMEFIRGKRSLLYMGIVVALALVPSIVSMVVYNNNKDSKVIKHLVSFGFAALYTVILFTTTSKLVFTYVIPMLIAITMYMDVSYSIKISIGVIVENIVQAIILYNTSEMGHDDIVLAQLQVLIIIIICVYSVITSYVTGYISDRSRNRIMAEKDKTTGMLDTALDVSNTLGTHMDSMSEHMSELGRAMNDTQEAMSEVNTGAAETATVMQEQLANTEDIQTHISNVEENSERIAHDMRQTQNAINAGKESIDNLTEHIKDTEKANSDAVEELGTLEEFMEKMKSIIDLIENITSQTSLLALNASIEAARAGEAGKGFAVVATEITSLANQTQNATVNIAELIDNFSGELSTVIDTINVLIANIKEQSDFIQNTKHSFDNIARRTDNVQGQVESLTSAIDDLSDANENIVNNVQTVSAISQQVSAHSSETLESSNRNKDIVDELCEIVAKLDEEAAQLRALQHS